MENQRPLIVTGLVLIIILALIGGVIFYLVNFIRSRQSATTGQLFPKASTTASPRIVTNPVTGSSNNGSTLGNSTQTNVKIYQGDGFRVQYPSSWGILTCSNSQNFEFDPTNSKDQSGVVCNSAVKPITVLVGQSSCVGGNVVELGGEGVTKVVSSNIKTISSGAGTQYEWCTSSPTLDITERVGTGPAFSTQDYSAQIEQMISSLGAGGGS